MATCLNEVVTNMNKNLTLVDVMCPVCRGIFIEPVIMPCHHGLCLQCFERTMKETSFTCPMCRKRIGSWLRAATKEHNLVNNELWAIIQNRFPEQVQAKLNGEDDGIEEHVLGPGSTHISSPGQIRREYELQIRKLEEEAQKKLKAELRLSEDLIRKIQEEDEKQYLAARQQLLDQTAADEQIAKELLEQSLQSTSGSDLTVKWETSGLLVGMDNKENKSKARGSVVTQIKGPMDSYVIAQRKKSAVSSGKFLTTSDSSSNITFGSCKLKTVSEPNDVRCTSSTSTDSNDSINQELHHFKPIKRVPRTPPKKVSDGRVLIPMVVKAVPMNLNTIYESFNESSVTEPFISTSSYKQRLLKVHMERTRKLKDVLRTSEVNPPCSAFRGRASFLQKAEVSKPGSDNSEREHSTEDAESPRKKSRNDIPVEEQKSNFALTGLSSYSDEDYKGKKVIAIVHDQADALVEVAGKIGGHDRRFGSEQEDNCDFRLMEKVADRDESDDELNFDNEDVIRTVGAEPESCDRTPAEIRYKSNAPTEIVHGSSSSGVNFNKCLYNINTEKALVNHCRNTHYTQQNNIRRVRNKNTKNNNNNNNDFKTAIKDNMQAKTQASGVTEKCKDNLADIVPFVAEDASLMLSQEQAQIRQEQADLELALRLQQEWDEADRRVDRRKGSLLAYELRNTSERKTTKKTAAKKAGRGRQSTLEESFTRALHSVRKQ